MAASVEHHVGGLEIAMQHAAIVRGGQPGRNLAPDVERLVGRQTADSLEQRGQVLAVDVLHRQEVRAVELGDVVDAAHVRVRHLTGQADFRQEPFTTGGVVGQRARQELERDRHAEFEVVGAVDLAHAAAAE